MTTAPDPQYVHAEVIYRKQFSDDVILIRIRPGESVTHTPGQYATLALETANGVIKRPYSIASSPHEEYLEFCIDLVRQGELTPRLWALEPGDTIYIRKRTAGAFVLDEKSGLTNHLFCGTVTGAAPFLSIVRFRSFREKTGEKSHHRFLMVHGASFDSELGTYQKELSSLAEESPWFTYVPTISRAWDNPNWKGEIGRIEDVVRKYADKHKFFGGNTMAYACGNPHMIRNLKDVLHRGGFPPRQFKEEKYFQA